jgi:uncharacterized membrane protein
VVYLSQSKIRFLLASLSYLMGAVLINSLTKIKVRYINRNSNSNQLNDSTATSETNFLARVFDAFYSMILIYALFT